MSSSSALLGGREPPERGAGFSRTLIFAQQRGAAAPQRQNPRANRGCSALTCDAVFSHQLLRRRYLRRRETRALACVDVASDIDAASPTRARKTQAAHTYTMSSTDASNREDTFGAGRRGEDTSRLETRLESAMEGINEEDNPMLAKSIKAAQAADESAKGEWLAACADGGVKKMQGEPDAAALLRPAPEDNAIDALRKRRLAQMKARAAQKQAWLALGHGVYAPLADEADFLKKIPDHARAVCHLFAAGKMDSELLRHHMRALSAVHLETYFCELDAEKAPFMLSMVTLADLPALLLCRDGKVVDQLVGVDRTFTTEGVAYELGERGLVDFEEGTSYDPRAGKGGAASGPRDWRAAPEDDDASDEDGGGASDADDD